MTNPHRTAIDNILNGEAPPRTARQLLDRLNKLGLVVVPREATAEILRAGLTYNFATGGYVSGDMRWQNQVAAGDIRNPE